MTLDIPRLSLELDDLIRATPGVTALSPAEPTALAIASSVVAGALSLPVPTAVSVTETRTADASSTILQVKARIAVDSPFSAADVSREVHDRIVDHLAIGAPTAATAISVSVAQIVD